MGIPPLLLATYSLPHTYFNVLIFSSFLPMTRSVPARIRAKLGRNAQLTNPTTITPYKIYAAGVIPKTAKMMSVSSAVTAPEKVAIEA